MEYLKSEPKFFEIEGMFRRAGFINDQNKLEEEFTKENFSFVSEKKSDPLVVSGLLKKTLAALPDSVIPISTHSKFYPITDIEDE